MKEALLRVLKTLILAYFITGILLLIVALLLQKLSLSAGQVRMCILLIYGISNIGGGMIFCKKNKNKVFFRGILSGVLYFSLLTAGSLIMNKGFTGNVTELLISFSVCITGGIIGGIMS